MVNAVLFALPLIVNNGATYYLGLGNDGLIQFEIDKYFSLLPKHQYPRLWKMSIHIPTKAISMIEDWLLFLDDLQFLLPVPKSIFMSKRTYKYVKLFIYNKRGGMDGVFRGQQSCSAGLLREKPCGPIKPHCFTSKIFLISLH